MSIVLGLDLGSNSIGWCSIDEEKKQVISAGVNIFPQGVATSPQGTEESKNASRRTARQSRRQYERRKQRKNKLLTVLQGANIFPKEDNALEAFFKIEPYVLRQRGLSQELQDIEFCRVLYHINQRRGFKSSRKRGKESEGPVKIQTTELQKNVDEGGFRTLGEYLSSLNPIEQLIRGRYILRSMIEQEFELLWTEQRKYHEYLTDDLKKNVRDAIFYQRPLKSMAGLIGPCSLEKSKRRCRKDSLEFQRYRILEQVNRMRFISPHTGQEIALCKDSETCNEHVQELRRRLIDKLNEKEELKWDKVKKLLELPENTTINLELSGDSKLIGNRTEVKYVKIFGKSWHEFTEDEKDKIHQIVTFASDPEWLCQYAITKWGLSVNEAKKLAAFEFEDGYAGFSKKAIRKLLPYLEEGWSLAAAKSRAGYGEQEGKNVSELLKGIRNPIVEKTLYETLKLLHSYKVAHGEPGLIRIELARNLKQPSIRRMKALKDNRNRQKENDLIRAKLEEMQIKPTGDAVLRYRLWEECRNICPYTGKQISIESLFSSSPEFQVEHIIPYSRCLDDSYINKTLCHITENNIKKGDKTPFEAYSGTVKYDEILQRIKSLPYNKQKKFTLQEIEQGFINRQLNDTAYVSRHARTVFEAQGYKVQVTAGQATSILRHLWGMNTLLGTGNKPAVKNRDDHRHHAVDAAVVALTESK